MREDRLPHGGAKAHGRRGRAYDVAKDVMKRATNLKESGKDMGRIVSTRNSNTRDSQQMVDVGQERTWTRYDTQYNAELMQRLQD